MIGRLQFEGDIVGLPRRWTLDEIEKRICELATEFLLIGSHQSSPMSSFVDDFGCDSLDLVEFVMTVEEAFGVTVPDEPSEPVCKTIFTRRPFRIRDLAEIVFVQQGTGTPVRPDHTIRSSNGLTVQSVLFTQLGGRWLSSGEPAFESLSDDPRKSHYRRRADGMRCVKIPAADVEIGSDSAEAHPDEGPPHVVHIDSFLIDAEPVSTTAYCRFLNSIGPVSHDSLTDWFVLDPQDDRAQHVVITYSDSRWQPIPGSERWPMILVSWYGANAYSLWVNGQDWTAYRDESASDSCSYLPTEAQWEYAARGKVRRRFPWGDEMPSTAHMQFGYHQRSALYCGDSLPMADVNQTLGMSPFGLHHMAGNVWQWCRDWHDEKFFHRSEANDPNPVNRVPVGVRSEKGGSWVGPAELCRSSYRRGRNPFARGRCLGFRCISPVSALR